jgi:hypothetical protein
MEPKKRSVGASERELEFLRAASRGRCSLGRYRREAALVFVVDDERGARIPRSRPSRGGHAVVGRAGVRT